MKILAYALSMLIGLIVIGVGVLLASGGASGKSRNQISLTFNRPPCDVFPYLVEFDKVKTWNKILSEVKNVSSGDIRTGFRYEEVLDDGRMKFVSKAEITSFDRNREMTVRTTNDGYECSRRYLLSEEEGGTRLDFTMDAEYKIWFARLFAPLVQRDAQKTLEQTMAQLKQVVESQQQ